MSSKPPLNVWLVATGEPLPTDGPHVRLLRVGILFRELASRGHRVHWWTSDFDHQHRTHRTFTHRSMDVDGGRITLMPSPGYGASISLRRLWDHRVTASNFLRAVSGAEPPDVVVCSYPTIELSAAVVRYGRDHGVPTIVDVRDLWPDVIWDTVLPGLGGPMRSAGLWPLRRAASWAIRNATAVTGITDAYVDWACEMAGRPRRVLDRPVSLTYPDHPRLTDSDREQGAAFWWERGVDFDRHWVAAFLGTVGRQFDFEPVLAAAARLQRRVPDLRVVLCGTGEGLDALRRQSGALRNVITPGWVEGPARRLLLKRARVGLGPYVDTENFRRNLPNKPVEYFAYGLPVVHSLTGVLDDVCSRAGSGIRYALPGNNGAAPLDEILQSLHDDVSSHTAMAAAARELFERQFRPDAVTDQLLELCRDVVSLP